MIDIKFIRDNAERVAEVARQKNVDVDIEELLRLDAHRREIQQKLDDINRERNELAALVKKAGKPTDEQISTGKGLKEQGSALEDEMRTTTEAWRTLLYKVPNMPSNDTPVGESEEDNIILREIGERPQFAFTPRPNWELGEQLGVIDNERAADVAGSRFTYLKGELVWLQTALTNLVMATLTNEETISEILTKAGIDLPAHPFMPVLPPHMLRADVMERMARLEPQDERYHLPADDLFLIGSAEHTLGPLHMNELLEVKRLPLRYLGISPAYRREAGSHGKDVRGILRLHQFDKIEMESFTTPEDSLREQDFLVAIQEHFMQLLKLPYRVVLKCTADMGGPDARAIDIETWMPGQDIYRETHTADLMTDYQARRLGIKVRLSSEDTVYAHMNDATAIAMGRTLIAILENYQQEDGSVVVPNVLRPYVPFERIGSERGV